MGKETRSQNTIFTKRQLISLCDSFDIAGSDALLPSNVSLLAISRL